MPPDLDPLTLRVIATELSARADQLPPIDGVGRIANSTRDHHRAIYAELAAELRSRAVLLDLQRRGGAVAR